MEVSLSFDTQNFSFRNFRVERFAMEKTARRSPAKFGSSSAPEHAVHAVQENLSALLVPIMQELADARECGTALISFFSAVPPSVALPIESGVLTNLISFLSHTHSTPPFLDQFKAKSIAKLSKRRSATKKKVSPVISIHSFSSPSVSYSAIQNTQRRKKGSRASQLRYINGENALL